MAKHKRNLEQQTTCPECKGIGWLKVSLHREECWYCDGTGTQSEEPMLEKDWERK